MRTLIFILCLQLSFRIIFSGTIPVTLNLIIKNSCGQPIWSTLQTNPGSPELSILRPGELKVVSLPPDWSGSLWPQTNASLTTPPPPPPTSPADFTGGCGSSEKCNNAVPPPQLPTGDCGSATVECNGDALPPPPPPQPTATVTFFTVIDGAARYHVVRILENELAITVVPVGGSIVDLNEECPDDFQVVCGNNYEAAAYAATKTFACASVDSFEVTFCSSSARIEGCCTSISTDGDDTKHRKRRKMQKKWKRIISILEYLGGFTVVLTSCISVTSLISIKRNSSIIAGAVEKIRKKHNSKEETCSETSSETSSDSGLSVCPHTCITGP